MRRKSRIVILFAVVLLMLIPGMAAEAKTGSKEKGDDGGYSHL